MHGLEEPSGSEGGEFFFNRDRIWWNDLAGQQQVSLVHDGPFELLALLQVECLGQWGGKINVELL